MAVTFNTRSGDGTTGPFSFSFEYIDESDVKVSVDGVTQATTAYTFPTASTIQFVSLTPSSSQTIRIFRDTDIDDLKATFFAGSSIRAQDLNNNFEQNNFAVQEIKDQYVTQENGSFSTDVDMNSNKITELADPTADQDAVNKRYLESVTWDDETETIHSDETWVANNTQIATTGAIENRVSAKIDTAIEGDVLVDGTGLTKSATGGQVTLGIGANSVDFDRIKDADIITEAEQDAGTSAADTNVFTALGAARRFDTLVQTGTPSGTAWETGKTWFQNDNDKTVYVWDGNSWEAITSGGAFTKLNRVIYVDEVNGDDNNEGHRISNPKASIKAAVDAINNDSTYGDGSVVLVAPGVYQETAPIQIKKKNVSVIGAALRSTIVHPTQATEENTLFEVNSGSYLANMTFTGVKASGTRGHSSSVDPDSTYGLPQNQGWNVAFYSGATILKSPYIQNCTNFSDSEIDNTDLRAYNPRGGQADDTDSAMTGGGLLVDGDTVDSNSPLRSMVCDSYTHVGLDGPGILVTNNGYVQATSSYAFFNHYHIKCINGGQANLAASTSDFGRYSLIADGKSSSYIFKGSTTAEATSGSTTFTIGTPTAASSWHGSATRPQDNMLVTIGGNEYPVLSATASGSGWTVTISRPDTNDRTQNLGLSNTVASGSEAQFFLRSMIASSGHTMEYVGSGTNYNALPENGGVPVEANQKVELNNGKVWSAITDHNGKFSVGGTFSVNQQTGFVSIPAGALSVSTLLEDLNVNGKEIKTATTNQDIVLNPNGTGVVNVSTSKITNVVDPTDAQDAATKNFVDNLTTSTTAELNILDGATLNTSELNTLDGITASTAELNQLDGKTITTTFTGSNTNDIPTSSAVNSYVVNLFNALGGFVAIDNENSFPNSHPDPQDGAGTVVSIADAGGLAINSSGVATGQTLNSTSVTINGFPSHMYSETLAAGLGVQVQTTSTEHTYTFHKLIPKDTDILRLSDDINDFNNRYRVGTSNPTTDNDAGDLFFNTGTGKMLVYDAGDSAWEEVQSIGDFLINTISSSSGTGGGSATFNGTAYRFTLNNAGSNVFQMLVSVNGVIQKPNSGTSQPSEGFALDGADIIFSDPPASGSPFFIVTLGSTVNIGEPSNNTVTAAKIVDGTITNAEISSSAAIAGTKISPDFGAQDLTVDTDTLFVDASTDRVGVNTTSPISEFGVVGRISAKRDGANRIVELTGLADVGQIGTAGINHPLTFAIGNGSSDVERMRIDSSGRLLVGASSDGGGFGASLQVRNDSGLNCELFRSNAASSGPYLALNKSRGSAAAPAIVQSGDTVANVVFKGYDGVVYREAAQISAAVDATPGSGDMPGRLVFSTTADAAASPTERMRIDSSGRVGIGLSSPDARLHVAGGEGLIVSSFSSNTGLRLNYGNSSGQVSAINLIANGITNGYIGMQMVDGSNGDLYLGGSGGRALTVYRDRNIGIGTTDPSDDFTFGKAVDLASTTGGFYYVRDTDATNGVGGIGLSGTDLYVVNKAAGNIRFFNNDNTSERFRIGSAGQLGIAGANYGSSGQVLTSQGSSSAPQWATPSSPAIVQKVVKEYSTASTFTTPYLTFDNTIPQSSETHLLFTQTFTPVSTSNKLFLTAQIGVMDVNSGGNPLLVGIYDNQPGGASARAVAWHTPYPANYAQPVRVEYEVGGTLASSYTFSVRVGSTGATWAVNRRTDAQYFGGTVRTYLTIEEFS